ncbi:hypothetical protein TNCV_3310721 [Trichonephila clavipes]|nr:hypothetical protein TNCV_3310721 [Trichonephila clavipes]
MGVPAVEKAFCEWNLQLLCKGNFDLNFEKDFRPENLFIKMNMSFVREEANATDLFGVSKWTPFSLCWSEAVTSLMLRISVRVQDRERSGVFLAAIGCWGNSLVYADKPQTLDHLEDNIRRVIANIRPQILEKVIENWTSRLDYIRASRGSHIPEIILKM